jgi:hypothetical protein
MIAPSSADRRGHDDFFDAGNFGRDHIHQHSGWIASLAAGNVNADALERRDALPKYHPQWIAILPALLQLAAVKQPRCAWPRVEA